MSRTNTISGAAALASVIFVGGCAGNQPIPAASIQQAEQRIDEAERADAQRYANREINMAREKLLQAREAQDDGDEELAARLAEHAELDAAYAIALSENESVQAAVDELRATLATLESELQRNQRDTTSADEDIDLSLRDEELDSRPLDDGALPPGESENPLAPDPLAPDPLRTDPLDTDPLGPDPLQTDPLGPDPLETNPLGADPQRADPLQPDPLRSDPLSGPRDDDVPDGGL